jgi:hypothetical protein
MLVDGVVVGRVGDAAGAETERGELNDSSSAEATGVLWKNLGAAAQS